MGRKKRPPTKLVRIRLADIATLKKMARKCNLSLPDYISMIASRRYK